MLSQSTRTEGAEGVAKKLCYSRPRLVRYGAVSEFTKGGSSNAVEQTGAGATCGVTTLNRTGSACSDRQAKEHVVRIGVHPLGISLYLFDYKAGFRDIWGQGRQFGVMADEVEKVMPEAVVIHPDGYKMVDYALLGISRSLH